MSLVDRVRALNRHDPTLYVPFHLAGQRVGHIRRDRLDVLAALPDLFTVWPDGVALRERPGADPATRSRQLAEAAGRLAAGGALAPLRDELYPIVTRWGGPQLAVLDRAAVPFFGARAFGLHLNGWVGSGNEPRMWIGRRARDLRVSPGKLDNMVAGGQPAGLTVAENLVKEAAEEASVPAALARQARPVGLMTYRLDAEQGLRRDTIFCFDLELPAHFTPVNQDGEVEEFQLMPVSAVARIVADSEDFKFNCGPVIIDFMIRHGALGPDHPDYEELARLLRMPL